MARAGGCQQALSDMDPSSKQANKASGSKLKGVVQLVKSWRFTKITPIPLSSLHLELALATAGTCIGAKSYSECLTSTFQVLARRNGAAIRDPVLGGLIKAADTRRKARETRSCVRVRIASCWARLSAELIGDTQEAIRQWRIVFNDSFPK